MSTVYGGGGYAPPRKVNFGWIGESWQIFGRAAGAWIVAILVYGLVNNLITALLKGAFPNPGYVAAPSPFGNQIHFNYGITLGTNSQLTPLGQLIYLLFTWTYGAFQSASLYHMAVRQVRGEPVALGDAFGGAPYWANMLLFNLIVFLAAMLGGIALCVGAFFTVGLLLPGAAMVADGRRAGEAVSVSIDAMKSDWLTAGLFLFVFTLLIGVSVIPCFLGLFVTIPMLHIVSALAYRDMAGMPGVMPPAGPTYGAPQPGVWPPPPGQAPPPTWGQTPGQAPPQSPPEQSPPRTSLSGEPMDDPPNPLGTP
ncbi:MAG: hypothetical protein JO250_15865 [Armatimonadetes bacterium]|nr:hypothetical protein [Armatimonadota bacterium]